ncbi:MAG: ABC transporter substrate-binding protein [Deltaproteobacteria bacterium]|nr:ABC transporter substrate-binding protein [Deltaproteobacteria bacterium]
MKRNVRLKRTLGLCIATILFIGLIIVPAFAKDGPKQTGDVVFATYFPNFYQKGGDPATHTNGFPVIGQTIFDSLVWADKDQNIKPALCKSFKIHEGWKVFDFFIRGDVKFHNGVPVTAQDIKYSLETYLRSDLKFLFQPLWVRCIESIEVLDPLHLRITLDNPNPGFMGRLWWAAGVFPEKYREAVGDDGFADKPIGAGPFKWVEYKQDVYWKAEAVKNHYRKTPEIKTFKMVYVPEHSTRLAMLKAGEADLINLIGPHIPLIKATPSMRLIWGKWPSLTVLAYADLVDPDTTSPFQNMLVRKAASLAIDRKAICEKLLFGASEPYGELLSPLTWGYDPAIKPNLYDPEAARELLAQAGYPKGFQTTISTTRPNKFWVEAIAANLKEVGIRTKIEIYEGGAWQSAFFTRKLRGLITTGFWHHSEKHVAADTSDFLLNYMPWAYYTTPEIHRAILEARSAITEDEMTHWGEKISKMVRDRHIRLFLWANHTPYGAGAKIEFWEPQLGAMPGTAFEYIKLKR